MNGDIHQQIYAHHAEMCKVLSHPKRLEIIDILRDREISAGELGHKLGLPPANLSQHLAMMRERRVLTSRKEGNVVYYHVTNPRMLQAYDILREILFEQIRQDASLIEVHTT
jgi:ArsR family transcriptional regulator